MWEVNNTQPETMRAVIQHVHTEGNTDAISSISAGISFHWSATMSYQLLNILTLPLIYIKQTVKYYK